MILIIMNQISPSIKDRCPEFEIQQNLSRLQEPIQGSKITRNNPRLED